MSDELKLIGFDLSHASVQVIEVLLDDPHDPSVFMDIFQSNRNRQEILELLVEHPSVPEEVKEEAGKIMHVPATIHDKPAQSEEMRKQTLHQRLQHLSVGERIHLALIGGRDIRSLLMKDASKEVVLTVMKNPKITESEVELIAHSRNVSDEVLRTIQKNREWMKNYSIIVALVNNPKTPTGIGMSLVGNLRPKDIANIEKNKNVPEAIRALAKKLLQAKKPH